MSNVLTLNGGSSSVRFAAYDATDPVSKLLDGKIERIGAGGTTLTVNGNRGQPSQTTAVDAADHRSAALSLIHI